MNVASLRVVVAATAVACALSVDVAGAAEVRVALRSESPSARTAARHLRAGSETRPILEPTGREGLAMLPAEVQQGGLVVAYAPVPEKLLGEDFVAEALIWDPQATPASGTPDEPVSGRWSRLGTIRHAVGAATVSVSKVDPDRASGSVITSVYARRTTETGPQVATTEIVEVPRGARLHVAYVVDESDARGMAPLILTVTALREKDPEKIERLELFRREIPVPDAATDWADISLDLESVAGRRVKFEFRAEAKPAERSLTPHLAWSVPSLLHKARGMAPPSVVLVSVDGVRSRSLGCCGGVGATPFLDGFFGRDGAIFRRALAESSLSLSSHASLLTGATTCRHGLRAADRVIDRSVPTIAERFATATYDTAAFVDSAPLVAELGFARGFDRYVEASRVDGAGTTSLFTSALDWAAGRGSRPFFLFLHGSLGAAGSEPSDYEDAIRRLDGELRDFLLRLDQVADPDRLIVAVTSGKGEDFRERGDAENRHPLSDPAVHVPFFLRGGGVKRGSAPAAIFGSIDVGPTLLALAGLEAPLDVEGANRAAELRQGVVWSTELRFLDAAIDRRAALPVGAPWSGSQPSYAAVEGQLKLVRDGLSGREYAFDVLADPDEKNDLTRVESPPAWITRLRDAVDAHAVTCEFPTAATSLPPIVPPQARQQLAALGYLD